MRAQIEAFLAAGLTPTHFDPHQGAVLSPEFVGIYVRLGVEYKVPIVFPRDLSAYGPLHNLAVSIQTRTADRKPRWKRRGMSSPTAYWRRRGTATPQPSAVIGSLFAEIGPGLTFMAMHANAPGEIEFIEPDTAAIRIEEYTGAQRRRADRLDRRPARTPWHPPRIPDSPESDLNSKPPRSCGGGGEPDMRSQAQGRRIDRCATCRI